MTSGNLNENVIILGKLILHNPPDQPTQKVVYFL